VKPRVSNLLSSSSRGLAQSLDGKRNEGERSYTFMAPNVTIKDRYPGLCGWIQLRRCSSPARSWHEEEGMADTRVPRVSETGEESTRGCSSGPAHAGVRRSGGSGSVRLGPTVRRRGASRLGRASRPLATCKLFFFYICFPNHLNRFSNPNQIKSKPHHTIKQMQQYECIIKYST
jgi:hypothetical protein